MAKIAFVQNQTYMSYASKADVRELLIEFGYNKADIVLYTSYNITSLKSDFLKKTLMHLYLLLIQFRKSRSM